MDLLFVVEESSSPRRVASSLMIFEMESNIAASVKREKGKKKRGKKE
jgi:hypothetical protein